MKQEDKEKKKGGIGYTVHDYLRDRIAKRISDPGAIPEMTWHRHRGGSAFVNLVKSQYPDAIVVGPGDDLEKVIGVAAIGQVLIVDDAGFQKPEVTRG